MNWLIIAEILTVIGAFVSVVASIETIFHIRILLKYMSIVIKEKEDQVKRDDRSVQALESIEQSLKVLIELHSGDMLADRAKLDVFFNTKGRNVYKNYEG